jgi:DNA-binding CsgD family transcriptional regulator
VVLDTVQPTEHGSEHAVDQAFCHEIQSQLSALSRFCKSLAHRKHRVTTMPLEDFDAEAPQNADPMELRDAVQTLVRHLSLRQQWIFLLREVFQYTSADIAECTGMTEGAVKAALYRARQKLQSIRNDAPGDTPVGQRDVQHEENTVAAYLAAIANDNPQLFLQLLARVQMQSDVHAGDICRNHMEICQRRDTQDTPAISLHTTRSRLALAA